MGPAPNLKLYAQHVDQIIGVDCNPAMHGYARQAAEAAHAADKLRLLTGRAEALPLEDGSADAVVMTHVLCTVGDQRQALAEARRVLKPGGRFVFLEHVAAPQGQWLHTMQHALNPAVGFFGHGCSCCRDTLAAIRAAGFAAVDAEEFTLPIWGPLAVIGPHIAGVARK
ncbi:methyltransferase [Chlorella sorokiniana]|uniref:Methyltransferase n=1 Tax=Chlorella sorokiniana TaxID=3076 RepID=A0A2P6TXP5_CHLSO|nr:methyltransferase [Chlorella sorokiniana]|eukprot:PRW58836.1 methyltransferase [Chlorella sorokiniana]